MKPVVSHLNLSAIIVHERTPGRKGSGVALGLTRWVAKSARIGGLKDCPRKLPGLSHWGNIGTDDLYVLRNGPRLPRPAAGGVDAFHFPLCAGDPPGAGALCAGEGRRRGAAAPHSDDRRPTQILPVSFHRTTRGTLV